MEETTVKTNKNSFKNVNGLTEEHKNQAMLIKKKCF